MDMVEAAGCEAIGASNADEAVRVLQARADIRAIFTDVQMPGSMDGLALMRLTKKRWPSVVRLVTSGQTGTDQRHAGRSAVRRPVLQQAILAPPDRNRVAPALRLSAMRELARPPCCVADGIGVGLV
jgi:CheY-like chemotaxis protein